jgi:hypothetical protein
LDRILRKQPSVTHNIMFTDGEADKYNFVHGGPGVGIHVRIGNNVSEDSGKMYRCTCCDSRTPYLKCVCGRYVVAMQYDSEQKLCEN